MDRTGCYEQLNVGSSPARRTKGDICMHINDGKRITHNRCQCNVCKDIIESKHVHDFVQCSCRRIFTDGGTEYVRRGCESPSDIVDLTEYESNAEALIRVNKETYNIESGRF